MEQSPYCPSLRPQATPNSLEPFCCSCLCPKAHTVILKMPECCCSFLGQTLLLPWWMAYGWPNGAQGCKETPMSIFRSWKDEKASPEREAYTGSAQLKALMGSSSTAGHPRNTLPAKCLLAQNQMVLNCVHAVHTHMRCIASIIREGEGWEKRKAGNMKEESRGVLLLLCSSLV